MGFQITFEKMHQALFKIA